MDPKASGFSRVEEARLLRIETNLSTALALIEAVGLKQTKDAARVADLDAYVVEIDDTVQEIVKALAVTADDETPATILVVVPDPQS
jgi:hypothetical protein